MQHLNSRLPERGSQTTELLLSRDVVDVERREELEVADTPVEALLE